MKNAQFPMSAPFLTNFSVRLWWYGHAVSSWSKKNKQKKLALSIGHKSGTKSKNHNNNMVQRGPKLYKLKLQ